MSFISCDIDQSDFEAANASIPLYPGMTNRWLIAFPARADEKEIKDSIRLFFVMSGVKLSTAGISPDVEGLRLDKWTVGPKFDLKDAAQTIVGFPLERLPADYIYAGIRFIYKGTLKELRPWPWKARGFFIKCPEDILMAAIAVFPPVSPTKEDLDAAGPGLVDAITAPLEETAREIGSAMKMVLWAGAGLLVWHIHSSLKGRRS